MRRPCGNYDLRFLGGTIVPSAGDTLVYLKVKDSEADDAHALLIVVDEHAVSQVASNIQESKCKMPSYHEWNSD
jgi:hypothetical protein